MKKKIQNSMGSMDDKLQKYWWLVVKRMMKIK